MPLLDQTTHASTTAEPSPPEAAPLRDDWLDARRHGVSGSACSAKAATRRGSREITLAEAGDFSAGQDVLVSHCNPGCVEQILWGPHGTRNRRTLTDEVEVRGCPDAYGKWVVYLLDIDPSCPRVFRWSADMGRTWHADVPLSREWQPLDGAVEVRFNDFSWRDGYTVTLAFRDQLATRVERVDGNTLTLRDAPLLSVADAVVRHDDRAALQAAVDRAIAEKRNLFLPAGHYRLSGPVVVAGAGSIAIEGQGGDATVLDIGEGRGACLSLRASREITLRNLGMAGHMGFDARDQAGWIDTRGHSYMWGFILQPSSAVGMSGVERLLVENCHARRMSGECFYAGPAPKDAPAPPGHRSPKSITYLRCSVEDCARNAFNNNFQGRETAEDTHILDCRIQDVGGCAWEGASRFVHFTGNHVRNAGTVAMGNIRSRDAFFEAEGRSAQHIVADNVFEGRCSYGLCAIRAAAGAAQVVIRDNLFVDYNSGAIDVHGDTGARDLPVANVIITGNLFDMTAISGPSVARVAVDVSAPDTTVADNQIYARGGCDPLLTGIRVRDDAVNLNLHDNLIRACGTGIEAVRIRGQVGEVLSDTEFRRRDDHWSGRPPLPARGSHGYRNWTVVWLAEGRPCGTSTLDHFDAETCRFTLREPRRIETDACFEIFPPEANWTIHSNTITGCLRPVLLDAYGSATSIIRDNLVARGGVEEARTALDVRGGFVLSGNRISGFDGAGRSAVQQAERQLIGDNP